MTKDTDMIPRCKVLTSSLDAFEAFQANLRLPHLGSFYFCGNAEPPHATMKP